MSSQPSTPPAPPSTATPSLAAVLRRDIPWDTYLTARLIREEDLAVLRRVDRAAKARRATGAVAIGAASPLDGLVAEPTASSPADTQATAALIAVLHGVTKDETVQYALALLETEVVRGSPQRAAALLLQPAAAGSGPDGAPAAAPVPVLLRLLTRPDWFAQERAAGLLAAALAGAAATAAASTDDPHAGARAALMEWAVAQLRRPAHPARAAPAAAGALARLLRDRRARTPAVRAGVAPLLVPLIRAAGAGNASTTTTATALAPQPTAPSPSSVVSPQLAYDACIAAWLLALDPAGAAGLEAAGAVPALVAALRAAAKEKAVRAAALALHALLGGGGPAAAAAAAAAAAHAAAAPAADGAAASPAPRHHASPPPPPSTPADAATVAAAGAAAVEAGLDRAASARAAQAWADPDLPPLLAALGAAADAAAAAASTWDAYRAEVLSGRLRWGPAHTSPAFWAEHGTRLEDRGLQVLKVLVAMLQAGAGGNASEVSTVPAAVDSTTLAVACADVASYLAAVPHGRSVLADLGGKAAAMRLLAHADPEVRRHALAAVQRLVLPREVLGGSGVGEVVGAMAGVAVS